MDYSPPDGLQHGSREVKFAQWTPGANEGSVWSGTRGESLR